METYQWHMQIWQYITYLERILSPIPSCNTCNTSHLMCIVRLKRVFHKIPRSKKILISDYSVNHSTKSTSHTCHTHTYSHPGIVSLVIPHFIICSCLSHTIIHYTPYAYLPDKHCPFSVWPTSQKTCAILRTQLPSLLLVGLSLKVCPSFWLHLMLSQAWGSIIIIPADWCQMPNVIRWMPGGLQEGPLHCSQSMETLPISSYVGSWWCIHTCFSKPITSAIATPMCRHPVYFPIKHWSTL